ncbi:ribosomal protein S16 domain-containing protein [Pestalotiopsis sp. NC0098]|nr:ribosomal protein S16 domain-containing protein [Pestalotiopsis sp. NC0098]
MTIKIRLARFGRRNAPLYNIVVAQARSARNSKPLEVIGTYDPMPKADPYDDSGRLHKDIKLDILRAKYWLGVGAQPSDTMWRLMSMVGILEPKHIDESGDRMDLYDTTCKDSSMPRRWGLLSKKNQNHDCTISNKRYGPIHLRRKKA